MEQKNRTKCEVFSRVCGYLRPVETFNEGKLSEFTDRLLFK
jgi:anaerobic ribonucleoside-triphosphate reductase